MADAAVERGYEYIAITDHSKGLSIVNGINEVKLKKQSGEIDAVNRELRTSSRGLTVLHSIEMNLNRLGEGDMDPKALRTLDLVLGSFHSALRRKEDQTERRAVGFTIIVSVCARIGKRCFARRPGLIKQ